MTRTPPSSEPVELDIRAVERRIATELARLAIPLEVAGQQLAPPPYLRRHLVEHAAAGDVLDNRTLPRDFLPYLDLPRLRASTASHPTPLVGELTALPALRRATHQWDFHRPDSNDAVMQIWAAVLDIPIKTPAHSQTVWHVRWARWPVGQGEIVGKHSKMVVALAAMVSPDGRPIAVTGSWDDTVRIWDLAAGTAIGRPLTGHTNTVDSVAVLRLPEGRSVIVTGSRDCTVRVWDLISGIPMGEPLIGHTGPVNAVAALVLPGGRPIAVSGGVDSSVYRWDLTTGTQIGTPLPGHTSTVSAAAALVLPNGRAIAVTGSWDATVRVWDLTTGALIGRPWTGHTDRVDAVAALVLPDGRAIAVTGSWDATVRVWDLSTGIPIGRPLTGHTDQVCAVAALVVPYEMPIAVTGRLSRVSWNLRWRSPT